MILSLITNLVIIVFALWMGLASFVGSIRLAYRPLLYEAILAIIIAVPFLLDTFVQPWQRGYAALVFIPLLVANLLGLGNKTRVFLAARGIKRRDLLFFRRL
jgi:hypothetical protein